MMGMTNYMEILGSNQPWNMILFMLIPVGLAEALVATEFFCLYKKEASDSWSKANKILSILLGVYYFIITCYVLFAVFPKLHWRGFADYVAMGAMVANVIPAILILLLELNVIYQNKPFEQKLKIHFLLVIAYLVIAHIAMVFGMFDPALFGFEDSASHMMHHDHHMMH
ncbi:MAG: hypothetical protein IJR46_06435 [Neisseriaceae bacterium]|nr:hypothetical protein [Neisseriaceae bacterium]MBR0128847.1 hypothetical protein [Neisseriaceae bacterium]